MKHLTLFYPPSGNSRNYAFINKTGPNKDKIGVARQKKTRTYYLQTKALIQQQRFQMITEPCELQVFACPPDRRKRDFDNILKTLLDAMEFGGAIEDDCLIKRVVFDFGEVVKGGHIEVCFYPYEKRKKFWASIYNC